MSKSTATTPEQIRKALEQIHGAHAEALTHWAGLYVALGRALHAAESKDTKGCRKWLAEAAEWEADVLGSSEVVGPLKF